MVCSLMMTSLQVGTVANLNRLSEREKSLLKEKKCGETAKREADRQTDRLEERARRGPRWTYANCLASLALAFGAGDANNINEEDAHLLGCPAPSCRDTGPCGTCRSSSLTDFDHSEAEAGCRGACLALPHPMISINRCASSLSPVLLPVKGHKVNHSMQLGFLSCCSISWPTGYVFL